MKSPQHEVRTVEEVGRTVEEAVERAIAHLGVARDRVQVDVLDEGSRGVLGLGAREARVRVTVQPGADEVVTAILEGLLEHMGAQAAVQAQEEGGVLRVRVEGDQLGSLIGRRGQTLSALEHLLGVMATRRLGRLIRLELDVQGYRERRRAALEALARRTAERVVRQQREIALEPMEARERRIVHMALQDHPAVVTVSRGEGEWRRVVVIPREKAGQPEEAGEREPLNARYRSGERTRRPEQGGSPQRFERGGRGTWPGNRERTAQGRRPKPPRPGAAPGADRHGQGYGPRMGRAPVVPPWAAPPRVPEKEGPPGRRPEGLPADEELEAEIEALARRMERPPEDDQSK